MKPYIPIKVYRWYTNNKYKLYIFDKFSEKDNSDDIIIIKEYIYIDDNLDDALNKIALYILNYHKNDLKSNLFYCWNNNKALSHDINNKKWQGYNINPFLSTNRNSKELDEDISYTFNTNSLFNLSKINIVFNSDISEDLKKNKYYFVEKKIPTYNNYKLKDNKLYELVEQNIEFIKKSNDRFHRVDLYSKLSKKVILSNLFDNIHTKKNIALIQWINDNSKILYKMQKKHFIKKEQLLNWCNIDKITKINCINIYYIITKGCYCKITINHLGEIIFSYIFDIRKNINWEIINKTKIILTNYLKKYIKQNFKMREESLKLNTSFSIDNTTFTNLSNKITKFIDIFSVKLVTTKDKNQLICIYKRSSKYNDNLNINDYILSRFNLGISKDDIINELINFGFNIAVAKDEVDNTIDNIDIQIKQQNKIKDNGTIIIISKSNDSFELEITNSANYNELKYLLYWLSKIIASSRVLTKKDKKKIDTEIKKEKEEIKQVHDDNLDDIIDSDDEKLGELDYNLDDDDDELLGGALGKEKHTYLINLIRNLDKDLVSDNYARDKCQSDFQPIVLTKEEMEKLVKNKQDFYDNIIPYGSSSSKINYYTCPRVWCPASKIPLDPNSDNYECPLENEEPMTFFWGIDKTKKRYIKLIKPNEKGLCAPCCGKKEQKKQDLDKCIIPNNDIDLDDDNIKKKTSLSKKNNEKEDKKEKEDKEDKDVSLKDSLIDNNYLMNQKAPITNNRYGSISEDLHNILLPKVSYSICSKMIHKTQKCFIRKGINHRKNNTNNNIIKNDSIINCIANSLNFNSKEKLIDDIIKRMDIIIFLALENGNVCKAFMDINEIIPENNKKIIKKLNKNKKILNLFTYDDNNNLSLSRILNIYKSYYKFINYLKSNDYPTDKSPYYLYSLIAILYNKLLIIWEYDNDIKILCPMYSSYTDILTNLELNPELLMILKDGSYYEPIILKNKIDKDNKIIKLNDYSFIKNIIQECSKYNLEYSNIYNTYQNIYTLNQWINTKNDKYYIFDINNILINNDLSITHVLTKSNILLNFDKISLSLLPKFIKDMNIKNIKFYDDVINFEYNINRIDNTIFKYFIEKCKSLNINYDIGDIIYKNDKLFNSKLTIFELKLNNNNIIHVNNKNEYYKYLEYEKKLSYKWYNLQKLVADILIKKYNNETFIKEYNNLSRLKKINKLYNKYFSSYNNQKIIRIILEELPINNNKPIYNINNYINNIILNYKYDFMSYIIKEYKDELIFSQNVFYITKSFEVPNILLNYHEYMPYLNNYNIDNKDFIINNDNLTDLKLPELFNGKHEELPSKWRAKVKGKWNNLIIIKNYNLKNFTDFIKWLSNYLGIFITYNDIKDILHNNYKKIIFDKRLITKIFEDPSFKNEWIRATNIKTFPISKINDIFSKYTSEYIFDTLDKIFKNDNLYPNDFTMKIISDIFNVSILLIHRKPYDTTSSTNFARRELEDLLISSTFISASKNFDERPLFIFNKIYDTNYISYYPIIENNKDITINSIFTKYKYVSENIKKLIELHKQNLK